MIERPKLSNFKIRGQNLKNNEDRGTKTPIKPIPFQKRNLNRYINSFIYIYPK
jgi:hypothetical protein